MCLFFLIIKIKYIWKKGGLQLTHLTARFAVLMCASKKFIFETKERKLKAFPNK